jgi:hypothetical protein
VGDGVNGDPLSLFAQSRIGRHHLKAAVGAVTTTDVLVELDAVVRVALEPADQLEPER